MALYHRKKRQRIRRRQRRYTADYRRRRSSVIIKVLLVLLAAAALFAVGFFVAEPWLERTFSPAYAPEETSLPSETAAPTLSPSETPTPTATPEPYETVRVLSTEELTNESLRAEVICSAKENGFTTLLLPLKAEDGRLYYQSNNEEAKRIGAVSENAVTLTLVLNEIRSAGLSAAASVTVFDEPYTAQKMRKAAIKYNTSENSVLWHDYEKQYWQDPGLAAAREYEWGILRELAAEDFAFVSLSGCYYPAWGKLDRCGVDTTATREENIVSFLEKAKEILGEIALDVVLPADVAAADRHGKFENYGFPETLSLLPCDTLTVDLRLDRLLNKHYTAVTVHGIAYSEWEDDDKMVCILFTAAQEKLPQIGALYANETVTDALKTVEAERLMLAP